MRPTRFLWLCFFFCFLAALAHADGLPPGDPMMQVDDPTCTPSAANTQTISAMQGGGEIEKFTSTDGSGCFGFQIAQTSAAFTTLDIQVGAFFLPDAVNCTSNAFQCHVSNLDGNTVTDMFFTADVCTPGSEFCQSGFRAGVLFAVDLSPGGWGANDFYIEGNPTAPVDGPNLKEQFNGTVPEPSSIFLLCSGAAGFVGLRKRMGSTRR